MASKLIGQTLGIYKVIGTDGTRDTSGHLKYEVECTVCGWRGIVNRTTVLKEPTTCKHHRYPGVQRHLALKWTNPRLRSIYYGMERRCYDPNCKDYKYYGQKGIRICKQWLNDPLSFEAWSLSNGYKDGLTIDRINPSKDYSSENCRWISLAENVRRAGRVNWIEVNGEKLTGHQWSQKLGFGTNYINSKIRKDGLEKTKVFIAETLFNKSV